eukprot:g37818.t1
MGWGTKMTHPVKNSGDAVFDSFLLFYRCIFAQTPLKLPEWLHMKRSRKENNDFSSPDKELTKLIESASRSSDSSGSS